MAEQKYIKVVATGENEGTVVNCVMMDPEVDTFDPEFTWLEGEANPKAPGIGQSTPLAEIDVTTGDKETFEPIQLSDASGGFTVSYDGVNVNISCRSYDMKWLRSEFTQLIKNGATKGTLAYAGAKGILHDEYCIVWEDAKKILQLLETLP